MNNHLSVGLLLPQVAASLTRYYDGCLQSQLGIGFSQYKILSILSERPYAKQKDIARQLGQTEASVSRQVKIMYEDGLLRTRQRSEDRREHVTELTPRGERMARQASGVLNSSARPFFSHLSVKDQIALSNLLNSIRLPE